MNAFQQLILYCAAIMAASLLGGRISSLIRMTHLRTQLLMSGVGGLMLGIAMLHLFPHACELVGPSRAGAGALAGLTVMFLMIRMFHTHDHGGEDDVVCNHDHGPTAHDHSNERGIGWVGLFFGLMLHTIVDGVALAASVIAEVGHGGWLGLGGIGTFLAVALHKPLDAFAITSVMKRQQWSDRARWIANIAFSFACPFGAFAFYFGVSSVVTDPSALGWGLAMSAGFFIGIALADLLPEVAFHDHDRGKLTATFLFGILIAIGVENLPGHDHDHGAHDHSNHEHASENHGDHEHASHDPDHSSHAH
ncbi:MAG: ZIP family metal transporter [Planctomycetota bacterium]